MQKIEKKNTSYAYKQYLKLKNKHKKTDYQVSRIVMVLYLPQSSASGGKEIMI